MKHKNIDEILEQLDRVKQVDAPDFLYTRIQQKIHDLSTPQHIPALHFYWSVVFVLLLSLNIGVSYYLFFKSKHTTLVESMNLAPSLNVYEYE